MKIEKSWIAKHDDHFAWNMIIVVMVILVIMLTCHCSMAHCWSRAGTFQFQVGFRMGREVYADFLIKNLGIAWKSGMPCLFQRDSDVLCHLSLFEAWDSYTRLSPGQRKRWKQCSRKRHRPKSSLNAGLRSEHSWARDTAFKSIIMLNPKIPKLKTHEIPECDWEEHGRTLIFESESQPLQRKLRVLPFLDCQHPTSSMQTFGMLTASGFVWKFNSPDSNGLSLAPWNLSTQIFCQAFHTTLGIEASNLATTPFSLFQFPSVLFRKRLCLFLEALCLFKIPSFLLLNQSLIPKLR